MPPLARWTPLALAVALLAGCGYVGDPLPPALNIPHKITDLSARQQGGRIVLEFTIPQLTTDGLALKLGAVELQAGTWGNTPFDTGAWAAQARFLDTGCVETGPCRASTSALDWANREVFFRVRAVSRKGRGGDWSEFAVLRVLPPLEPPAALRAESVAQGVKLSWQTPKEPPDLAVRVRRRAGNEEQASLLATVEDSAWMDAGTEYGTSYEYAVQSVVKTEHSEVVSEFSAPVEITPRDSFAPAVPSGLAALAGPQSVELVWERNVEPDLHGYHLYRSEGDAPFARLADLVETPSYSDRRIEAGRRYRYAISAVDRLGNESERSRPVEVAVP